MSQNFKPETVEQGKEFAALYRDGWSAREIAERFGCCEETVRLSLIAAGCPRRKSKGRSEKAEREHLAALKIRGERYAVFYQRGWTLRDISAVTGRSHGAIRNALDAVGVARRARGCKPNARLRMSERRKEVARRYVERGEGIYHIAFVLDVCPRTITTDLQAEGVKTRDNSTHIWRKWDSNQVKEALGKRQQ